MAVRKLSPAAIVIFGITGDLARRKLLIALYNLMAAELLPDGFQIFGVTRSGTTVETLLDDVRQNLRDANEEPNVTALHRLGEAIRILTMDISKVEEYAKLKQALDEHEARVGACTNRLFYLAVPSQTFGSITELLGQGGLNKGCAHHIGKSRLLIEKPFGYDLHSARELITTLSRDFDESQIYRVDHYLAKETAQNILTFRFSNPLFRAVWDERAISAVMITAAESIGIEGRVAFYEQTGALRDIIQSHLLQLMSLVAMDQPAEMGAEAIHAAKLALLKAVKPIMPDKLAEYTVRGQYEGYLEEVHNHSSVTETYAAIRLDVDVPRWKGVPFLLRTGKALQEKVTEITLVFKDKEEPEGLIPLAQRPSAQAAPRSAGNADAAAGSEMPTGDLEPGHQNTLTLRIQPNEGISIELQVKKPGFDAETETTQMDFCYNQKNGVHPDAYERVLVDAMRGDKTLFATSDEVIASWEIVEHVVRAWAMSDTGLARYAQGAWGPEAAERLAAAAGTTWISQRLRICQVHSLDVEA